MNEAEEPGRVPGEDTPGPEAVEGLLRLLGLALRAGRLQVGFRAVERMVQHQERPLLILAGDIGPSQRHKVERWDVMRTVTVPSSAQELGSLLGRDKVAVMGLSDHGFVKGIAKLGF